MCDPAGLHFELSAVKSIGDSVKSQAPVIMSDHITFSPGSTVKARFSVTCHIRLMSQGKVIADQTGDRFEYNVANPGVHRVEAWLDIAGERRPWIYFNPIYMRPERCKRRAVPIQTTAPNLLLRGER